MRKDIQELRTDARVFQLSKCTACTFTLDLPAVHFMCMHSFHQRCLGDNEKECPECAAEYRSVLEMKRSLEQNAKDQDWFFQQVKNSKDGFSVIAEYFGKGVISKTINGPTGTQRSGNTSSNSGFWGFLVSMLLVILLFTSLFIALLLVDGSILWECQRPWEPTLWCFFGQWRGYLSIGTIASFFFIKLGDTVKLLAESLKKDCGGYHSFELVGMVVQIFRPVSSWWSTV